ncbi:MAG: hypothetical protein LBC57_00410 [Treponema sp.]|nr:hypothetical protein [Treponema sp.]
MKILNTKVPTITQEIKYGRKITDWQNFLYFLPGISEMMMAMTTARNWDVIRLIKLYRNVLRVMVSPEPDTKRKRKFSKPCQALPKTPLS